MYSEQSNQNLLSGLRDNPGFGCIQSVDTVDNNVVKRAYKIHFVPPPLAWFKHPKPNPISRHIMQKEPDDIGLWDASTKRPTTDRHFIPAPSTSEDTKEHFLTGPPAVCADSDLKALLDSKPLVKTVQGKQKLELPGNMFAVDHVNFKETPLFAITQHQAKLALRNNMAVAQLCSGMMEHLDWLVTNWGNPLDVSTFKGTTPGYESAPPSAHELSVADQIKEGLLNNSTWLPDLLSHLRDGLQVASNGLRTSMEYNAATMVASSHSGRLLVNSHLSEDKDANWKARLLQSTYNSEFLFGRLPLSSETMHYCAQKGGIKSLPGDILPQVKKVANKHPSKVFTKAAFALPSSFSNSSRSQPGLPFRVKGRGKAPKPKAQEPKANPPPPPKPKQPKKSKRK